MLLKFRAWDTEEHIMGEVTRLDEMEYVEFRVPHETPSIYCIHCHPHSNCWHPHKWIKDKIIIIQYIGLKDKGGIELYHKDICSDSFHNIWLIDWSDEYACFELILISSPFDEFPTLNICRVVDMDKIGNAYTNPELLEK